MHPVFYAFGWSDIKDTTSQADLYVSFDAVQNKNSVDGTWLLYANNFFPFHIQWPTYGGQIPIGCIAAKIVVESAISSNSLSMQFTGS